MLYLSNIHVGSELRCWVHECHSDVLPVTHDLCDSVKEKVCHIYYMSTQNSELMYHVYLPCPLFHIKDVLFQLVCFSCAHFCMMPT